MSFSVCEKRAADPGGSEVSRTRSPASYTALIVGIKCTTSKGRTACTITRMMSTPVLATAIIPGAAHVTISASASSKILYSKQYGGTRQIETGSRAGWRLHIRDITRLRNGAQLLGPWIPRQAFAVALPWYVWQRFKEVLQVHVWHKPVCQGRLDYGIRYSARLGAPGEYENFQLLRPTAYARIPRSALLLESSSRPS